MTNWLICIDDTDDIGTKGTGEIAGEIADILVAQSGNASWVTRHQLYVHPDIPYTSHNSAMCFQYNGKLTLEQIKALAIAHLNKECAGVSDPGLAILDLTKFKQQQALIDFGLTTKTEVKTKDQAYQLATDLGISLSEHGGTGQGVIGALAGLGLRLSGNDGRVKGQLDVGQDKTPKPFLVSDILNQTKLDGVISDTGNWLDLDETVWVSDKLKAVWIEHKFALLVSLTDDRWHNATKQTLKDY